MFDVISGTGNLPWSGILTRTQKGKSRLKRFLSELVKHMKFFLTVCIVFGLLQLRLCHVVLGIEWVFQSWGLALTSVTYWLDSNSQLNKWKRCLKKSLSFTKICAPDPSFSLGLYFCWAKTSNIVKPFQVLNYTLWIWKCYEFY